MPRPTTKPGLIGAANEQFKTMWKLIDSMTDDERNASFDFPDDLKQKEAHWKRDRNLRDVLAHLYEWHQLLLNWVAANRGGDARPFLPAPYTWKTYGDMNVKFWETHQDTPYADAVQMLLESHRAVLDLIDQFSDEALYEKRHFDWTGTTNLASYCISATSSHYDWAMKKIKQHMKSCRASAT